MRLIEFWLGLDVLLLLLLSFAAHHTKPKRQTAIDGIYGQEIWNFNLILCGSSEKSKTWTHFSAFSNVFKGQVRVRVEKVEWNKHENSEARNAFRRFDRRRDKCSSLFLSHVYRTLYNWWMENLLDLDYVAAVFLFVYFHIHSCRMLVPYFMANNFSWVKFSVQLLLVFGLAFFCVITICVNHIILSLHRSFTKNPMFPQHVYLCLFFGFCRHLFNLCSAGAWLLMQKRFCVGIHLFWLNVGVGSVSASSTSAKGHSHPIHFQF